MAMRFKGTHFPQEISVMGVRCYLVSPLSSRHVEARMKARGVPVDHATSRSERTKGRQVS